MAAVAGIRRRSRRIRRRRRRVDQSFVAARLTCLPLHVRAPAQELLDLALVAIGLLDAGHHRAEAKVLAEPQNGLARGEGVTESRCLQLAIVEAAAEAHLVQHLL